jgi:hypothetical protein
MPYKSVKLFIETQAKLARRIVESPWELVTGSWISFSSLYPCYLFGYVYITSEPSMLTVEHRRNEDQHHSKYPTSKVNSMQ